VIIALTPVGNPRSRRFLSVCTGCNVCRASATYVNVGFRHYVEVLAVSAYGNGPTSVCFGGSSGLVGRCTRPGYAQQPGQPGPRRNSRDPFVARQLVIEMSPLPARPGRATPGEDPARAGFLELPERAARRRRAGTHGQFRKPVPRPAARWWCLRRLRRRADGARVGRSPAQPWLTS
jgi:hypothetical protein